MVAAGEGVGGGGVGGTALNPLKYVGGKGWLTPTIAKIIEGFTFRTYYEPFVGSGAVYFWLRRQGHTGVAKLSDRNERLIKFYKDLRAAPKLFAVRYDEARVTYNTSKHKEDCYYTWREQANTGDALAFLLVNRAGYNGLWRENKSGNCNVPWGHRETLPDLSACLLSAGEALQSAQLSSIGWNEALINPGAPTTGDLVYLDAPYVGTFTGYGAKQWSADDDFALADLVNWLEVRGALVLWSLPDSEHAAAVLAKLPRVGVHRVVKAGQVSAGARVPQHELLAVIGGGAR